MEAYLQPVVLIAGGFAVLIAGGAVLVRGASGLAKAVHISPLVIGLTVVAFCTSAPELAVVLQASVVGQADDLAVGNVVGSCICNVLLVLGLSALVAPLVVSARLVRLEVPLMILVAVLVLVFGLDGSVGQMDALILFGGMIVYMTWTVLASRKESRRVKEELARRAGVVHEVGPRTAVVQMALILLGVGMLVIASRWLVDGAVDVAERLGVSELMIGLTILAVGTSLPEVATCVVASFRGHRDLAVGNVVGSNILNILAVLGLSGAVAGDGIAVSADLLRFDIPVMIVVSVACLPVFFTGHKIDRWEGALFVGYYLLYMTYLILAETRGGLARSFAIIVLVFVVPLTAFTLVVGVLRALRGRTGQ